MFGSPEESHNHSREVLDIIETFYEFMISVGTVADMGGGNGLDAEWWATRETDPEVDTTGRAQPLNIKSFVIDTIDKLSVSHKNLTHIKVDMENTDILLESYDVITSHDAFQQCISPVTTLKHWWELANPNAMLILQIPQTTNIKYNKHDISILSSEYYHYTLVNLIYMLAVNGWDCKNGMFTKGLQDPWIKAVVYKGEVNPMNPRTTSWRDLAELDLLSDSAVDSINRWGYVKQQDLVLPWFNGHLDSYKTH